jgi:hypothetical protein
VRGNGKCRGVRFGGPVLTLLLAASSIPPVAAGFHQEGLPKAAPALTAEGQASPPSSAAGVDANWWSTVQENIRRSEYYVTWQEVTYLDDVPTRHPTGPRTCAPTSRPKGLS